MGGGLAWWIPGSSSEVELAAASSLADVLEAQLKRMSDLDVPSVRLSTAGSQTVARQIASGKSADVVFLAHSRWMQYLEDREQLRTGSRRTLLSNRVVMIGPATSQRAIRRISELVSYRGPIAMGNPDAVPAGIYARQGLENLNLWSELSNQIVSFPHVRAVLSAVGSGNLPLGFVYQTDARLVDGVRVLDRIPPDKTPPIQYQIALTRGVDQSARRVFNRLIGSEARRIYRKYGFVVVEHRD